MKMNAYPEPSSTIKIRRCIPQTCRAAGARLASSHTGFKTGSSTAMGAAPEISPVRRLAAVLAADVAGYSRLMGADEEGTYERLKVHLAELVHPKITEHRGRVVKNMGDGLLGSSPALSMRRDARSRCNEVWLSGTRALQPQNGSSSASASTSAT